MKFGPIALVFLVGLYSGISISQDHNSGKIDKLGYLLAKASIQYQVDQKVTLFEQYKKVQKGTEDLEDMNEKLHSFELKNIINKRLDTGSNKDLLETIKKEPLDLKLECLQVLEWNDICKDYVCEERSKKWADWWAIKCLIATPCFVLDMALTAEYFFGNIYKTKPLPTGLLSISNTVTIFGIYIFSRYAEPYLNKKNIRELSDDKDLLEKSKTKAIEYMKALAEPLKENNCNSIYLGKLAEFFSLSKQKVREEKIKLFLTFSPS